MFLYIDFVFRNFTELIYSNSFLNEVFIRVYIYIYIYKYIYIYIYLCVLVAQSSLTLCDPMDCSPPSSSVHEIFQARILDWVAISFSRGSSQPRDQTQVSCNIYIYNIISSVNSDSFMLNRSGESGHPCLIPDLSGRAFDFSLLK